MYTPCFMNIATVRRAEMRKPRENEKLFHFWGQPIVLSYRLGFSPIGTFAIYVDLIPVKQETELQKKIIEALEKLRSDQLSTFCEAAFKRKRLYASLHSLYIANTLIYLGEAVDVFA